ncbi:MAG: hypothetical protein Q9191_008508 [Dirinaria sp. TL-2023a]
MSLNPVDYKLPEVPFIGRISVYRPSSPGIDYCGRVAIVGPSSSLKPGQLVFGRLEMPTKFGTLGQYIFAPEEGAAPLPPGVDHNHAAGIGTAGLTAYQTLVPFVRAGDHVFIHGGSGGTGTFEIQIAKALGCTVTTTCSTTNVQLCKDLGADEVLDYKTTDIIKALRSKGPVFALVVDNVGSPSTLYNAADHFLKEGGRFIQIGGSVAMGTLWMFLSRMFWPTQLGGGKHKYVILGVQNKRADFEALGAWVQQGRVKVVIDSVFDLQGAREAYAKLKTGRARGKICVRVEE